MQNGPLGPVSHKYLKWREGFEPSIRHKRISDFESDAFDYSAISPCRIRDPNRFADAPNRPDTAAALPALPHCHRPVGSSAARPPACGLRRGRRSRYTGTRRNEFEAMGKLRGKMANPFPRRRCQSPWSAPHGTRTI